MNQAANSPNQGQALLSQIGGGAGAAAGAGSATAQLQDIAQSVPKPVAAMLQTVSQSSSQATASGASQQLADAWTTEVYPLCQDAFNRYPFIKDSKEDVPPLDFKNLLGPGGKFDQFFDHYLKTLVNTSKKPWTWQAVEHSKLDVSAESLPEFELARDIRDAFFPDGGSKISVGFSLQPEQIDAGLAKISIEIGAQRKEFIHGPPERVDLQWPAPDGSTLVRVTMTPVSGNETRIEEDGAWALLRLLDVAHVTRSGQSDKLRIAFTGPAGGAEFVLTANSVHNPFTLPALGKFRCPAKL
jgi:type VI secretion system protein ImpL